MGLRQTLPKFWNGRCTVISLLLPVTAVPVSVQDAIDVLDYTPLAHTPPARRKRSAPWLAPGDPTYIDSIGVPRGVPEEYKLVDQIATGFENIPFICAVIPITPNKNVDRINYIHYNLQKLGNYTDEGFAIIHEQLHATSLMTMHNRIALDMLLAEKGGVCNYIGESVDNCCSFIPLHTGVNGSFTQVIEKLCKLNKKMKDHSGVNNPISNMLEKAFGKWKDLATQIISTLIVVIAIFCLVGCCCIPFMRSMCERTIDAAVNKKFGSSHEIKALLAQDDDLGEIDELNDEFTTI